MKSVFVDIERCTACKSCEIACAVEHSASKSLFAAVLEQPRPQKRIHVEKALAFAYPVRCVHCADAPCVAACPNGAMSRETALGRVFVNEERCQGCFMCAMVCQFGAISAHPRTGIAVKCDFCPARLKLGLTPACVEACPTGALLYGEEEDLSRATRSAAALAVARAVGVTGRPPADDSPLGVLRSLGGK